MMNNFIATTAQHLNPSGIRRFFNLADGVEDVISLGVGEPDFVTSWAVREASIVSLEKGYTSYTPNAGLLELRKEIAHYMEQKFKVCYKPENEIIVTVGASQALDIALRTILNPGDEVIIVEPTFVTYAPLVEMAGGVPIAVQTKSENEFKIQSEQIEEAMKRISRFVSTFK